MKMQRNHSKTQNLGLLINSPSEYWFDARTSFLMTTNIQEGLGQHRKVILRLLQLCNLNNKVLVEPCYQNGRIVMCKENKLVIPLSSEDIHVGNMLPFSFYWNISLIIRNHRMIPFLTFLNQTKKERYHFIYTGCDKKKNHPNRFILQ